MNLKQMRIQAGFTQAQLAQMCGINLRSLQDYEQGHKAIESAKGETLYRMSSILGYSINDILQPSCEHIDMEINRSQELELRVQMYQKAIEKRRREIVHFPVVEEDELVDMSRIYPTKQHQVKRVLKEVRSDKRLVSLRLFGSSITMSCNKDSDIDFAVEINELSNDVRNEISEKIQSACDWNADILWMDRIMPEERIYDDIMGGLVLI